MKKLHKIIGFRKIKGKIIHLGSIYGNISQDLSLYKGTSIKENFTYPLIKGGISKFMQQLAVYYAKYEGLNTFKSGFAQLLKNEIPPPSIFEKSLFSVKIVPNILRPK